MAITAFRCRPAVRMSGFHPGDPGSIPGNGIFVLYFTLCPLQLCFQVSRIPVGKKIVVDGFIGNSDFKHASLTKDDSIIMSIPNSDSS